MGGFIYIIICEFGNDVVVDVEGGFVNYEMFSGWLYVVVLFSDSFSVDIVLIGYD